MPKCTGCGADLPRDAAFCPHCARRVPAPAPAAVVGAGVATISDLATIASTGPSTPQVLLADGARFHGRYIIERQLGAGAMGVVYAAKDQVTGRTVALKLINPALADRPAARERFVHEGLMARDIRHANIVAMYDVGEANGQVYLVMEYLGGETLRKWLRRTLQEGRDIPFDTARGIVRRILEGLDAAHATGVVHRDLKPENVMLTGDPHDGDCGLKILDFGIAREVGATSHVTTTSSSTGTPLYMAPEQKTAADTVGPPADLYAVTAILYELLLGVAPEGRWGTPSKERADLPAGIDTIIETGLASRPRSRYQSATEYMKALDAIGAGPVVAVQPQFGPVTTPAPSPREEPASPPGTPSVSGWMTARSPLWDRVTTKSGWWTARAPAWALWKRLSRKQRYIVGAAVMFVILGIVGQMIPDANRQPAQPPMNIAGRWADEMTGAGVAHGFLDVVQQGNEVSAVFFDSFGNRAGTLSGRVDGTSLEYDYVQVNGMTGTGRGQLTSDGTHLDVEVRNNTTGLTQRHTLHRNHMPPQ